MKRAAALLLVCLIFISLPGSLAAYFFRRAGMRETEFVRRLVDIAERRFRDESRLTYSYSSPAVTGK